LQGSPKSFTCAPPAVPLPPAKGVKRWVTSPAAFAAWKLDMLLDVAREPASVVASYPKGPDMPAAPLAVQADDGSPEVWVVDGSTRRHVVSPASLAAWQLTVVKWPAAKVVALAQGIDWRSTRFAMIADGQPEVYVLDDAPTPAPNGNGGGGNDAGTPGTSGDAPSASSSADTSTSSGCSASPRAAGGSSASLVVAMLVAIRRRRRT
jgi:uncharacterized protein (TIGR03382 family)